MIVIDPHLADSLKPRDNTPLARLSPEELKVLELVAQGYSDKAIAEDMRIDERQVQGYMRDTCAKLGIGLDANLNPRIVAVRAYLDQTRDL